ncbi:hypothetical protein J1N35_044630 [Gossypium stocksii]|uniref:Uncharacterized protein n=1 Tax=Gossypium stocksii TaxID=47602 RepID=A0A9D3U9E3_9ROSI|nr:hypothetical protein J1N35_044630 [Gossypium stocksii]
MEWVIWWRQEMSPMGINYALRYGMPIPNPPPNKYPPMQFYGQAKYEEWKEEEEYEDAKEEGEELAHDYDPDNAFLPKQASVGGSNFATRAKPV